LKKHIAKSRNLKLSIAQASQAESSKVCKYSFPLYKESLSSSSEAAATGD